MPIEDFKAMLGTDPIAECAEAGRYALDSVLAEGSEECIAGRTWGWSLGPEGAQLAAPSTMRGCATEVFLDGGCALTFDLACPHERWLFRIAVDSGAGSVEVSTEAGVCTYESRLHALGGAP